MTQAEAELITAERALPQLLAGPGTPKQMNAALPGVHQQIEVAAAVLGRAKTALRPVPAKVLATDMDPNAKRVRPRLARRGLQMVLRLLAFNAEAWLAEHFNAYLCDPNEYRAILRNLLHLGGPSTTPHARSPSPWTGRTARGSPAPLSCWPTSSTPDRRACQATAAP